MRCNILECLGHLARRRCPATYDRPATLATAGPVSRADHPARVPGAGPDILARRHLDAELGTAIDEVVQEFNRHVGARRVSVWLHDRRERSLQLVASSDPAHRDSADGSQPAIQVHPPREVFASTSQRSLVQSDQGPGGRAHPRRAAARLAPRARHARRRRRVPDELEREQLLDLARELGRQLSAGIENVQLLEEIMRQRRLLEDTFNSLVDLVVVTDARTASCR